jgi:hypothetical protein
MKLGLLTTAALLGAIALAGLASWVSWRRLRGPSTMAAPLRDPSVTREDRQKWKAILPRPPMPSGHAFVEARPSSTVESSEIAEKRGARDTDRQRLEATLAASSPDEGWADRVRKSTITSFEGGNLAGTRIGHVWCGAAFCRLELGHRSAEQQESLAADLPRKFPFDREIYFSYEPQSLTTVVFVSRSGGYLFGGPPPVAQE